MQNILLSYKFKLVFLLGKPLHPQSQYGIEQEHFRNKDIVQCKFVDTYHNLSHKAVLGLRWVSEHCNAVHTIVKMDDDVFLNLPSLSTLVLKLLEADRSDRLCVMFVNKATQIT